MKVLYGIHLDGGFECERLEGDQPPARADDAVDLLLDEGLWVRDGNSNRGRWTEDGTQAAEVAARAKDADPDQLVTIVVERFDEGELAQLERWAATVEEAAGRPHRMIRGRVPRGREKTPRAGPKPGTIHVSTMPLWGRLPGRSQDVSSRSPRGPLSGRAHGGQSQGARPQAGRARARRQARPYGSVRLGRAGPRGSPCGQSRGARRGVPMTRSRTLAAVGTGLLGLLALAVWKARDRDPRRGGDLMQRDAPCEARIGRPPRREAGPDFDALTTLADGNDLEPDRAAAALNVDPGQLGSLDLQESAADSLAEYPLGVSRQTVFRVDLSTGGPADWLEVVCDGDTPGYELPSEGGERFAVCRIVYHFSDWFDHAERTLEGDELATAERFVEGVVAELVQ